jgi:DNA modification methylase
MMNYTLLQGDAITQLQALPASSVQCVVTSPPYWGLRDYGYVGQIGLEPTPQQYVQSITGVFREIKRVLRDDGTCWLNLGDSYAGFKDGKCVPNTLGGDQRSMPSSGARNRSASSFMETSIKNKDLVGIPWRVAFALQDEGWWLRSEIIWHKPNPMPESVRDRPTKAHENIFLLTKSAQYYYDAEAIAEPSKYPEDDRGGRVAEEHKRFPTEKINGIRASGVYPTRNARDVWEIATQSYSGAHFATFPDDIPERCIMAGTSAHGCCKACGAPWERVVDSHRMNRTESPKGDPRYRPNTYRGTYEHINGKADAEYTERRTSGWTPTCECEAEVIPCTVLDPFAGSGTTVAVAMNLGRTGIGIELNPQYIELAHKRILGTQPALLAG